MFAENLGSVLFTFAFFFALRIGFLRFGSLTKEKEKFSHDHYDMLLLPEMTADSCIRSDASSHVTNLSPLSTFRLLFAMDFIVVVRHDDRCNLCN